MTILQKAEDNAAFMRAVAETWEVVPLPISFGLRKTGNGVPRMLDASQ
jgi:hypothetical protein